MHIKAYIDQIIDRQNESAAEANKLIMAVSQNTKIPEAERMALIRSLGDLSEKIIKITSED